ncbi:MAG: 16S rRNA (guanine(527)-N(7))-methyltransferase RsmG [Candidatus Aenigmarchaeota archaeon]|nr:16S rRNA (guanine(527)-N(7))-methyltransferase RsmG [Candidatus Aenigmarchaeota archaeon]
MNEQELIELFSSKARNFNLYLDNEQLEKFREYLNLLMDFNSRINLVGSAEPETVVLKHFLDSLAIGLFTKEIDFNSNLNLIDIGIGGGFPGIPIMLVFPNCRLCAVDSVNKKLDFIRVLAEKLDISNRVEIITERAEDLAKNPMKREFFDIALIRAVSKMNVNAEYCLPFVKQGGYFISYKAKNIQNELEEANTAISVLGGKVISTVNYTLAEEEERNLVLIKKIKPTPEKYPRKTGMPAKKPLINSK